MNFGQNPQPLSFWLFFFGLKRIFFFKSFGFPHKASFRSNLEEPNISGAIKTVCFLIWTVSDFILQVKQDFCLTEIRYKNKWQKQTKVKKKKKNFHR